MPITCKIDVNKIDRSKLFQGAKGKYLDIVLIETPNNEYGDDYMVVQGVSQEDRLAGKKGAILGNAKVRGQKPSAPQESSSEPRYREIAKLAPQENLDEDTIPF